MITKYNEYIKEGYKEIDELYLLTDQIIDYFSKRSDKFFKDIKEEGYINKDLIDMVYNPNDYKLLIEFITEFTLNIQFSKEDNEKMHGIFLPEDETNYSDNGNLMLNINIPIFYKNLTIARSKNTTNNEILKYTLIQTFKKTIAHELQHAYDYFRSKGKFSKGKKTTEYKNIINNSNNKNDLNAEAEKLYYELPHEQWARFTEVIQDIDITTDFNTVLDEFKKKFRKYDVLDEKQKRRLTKALYQYYDMKNEQLTESVRNLLVGPSEEEVWDEIKYLPEDIFLRKFSDIKFKSEEIQKKYNRKKEDFFKNLPTQLLLERSIIYNYLDGVKKAVEDGADLNIEEIIYTAALSGNEEIIKYLLNVGTLVTWDVIDDIKHELIDEIEYVENNNYYIIELISSYIKETEPKIGKFKQFIKRISKKNKKK